MKQVFLKDKNIIVDDVPPPVLMGNGIVVKTRYSVISTGTELAAVMRSREGRYARIKRMLPSDGIIPYLKRTLQSGTLLQSASGVAASLQKDSAGGGGGMTLGYSSSGIVIARDERLTDIKTGDTVTCGGARHAGVNYVPKHLFAKLLPEVPLKDAAFATLGCIAMQGVRRACVTTGEIVAVIGQGVIGQLTARLVLAAGAYPIVTDLGEWRLDLAHAAGAWKAINASRENAVRRVLEFTGGIGADTVIICASGGTSRPIRDAIAMVRDKGRIVLVGDVKIDFPREIFYEKELDFMISRSYGPGRYDPVYEEKGLDYPYDLVPWTEQRNMAEFIRLLSVGKIKVADLISSEFNVTEAPSAYERMLLYPERTMAVVLAYDDTETRITEGSRIMMPASNDISQSGKIRAAVIGCGNFALKYHLPTLQRISGYSIAAVVDAVGAKAKETAQRYGARYCTSDYREVINDPAIDLTVITTRHDLHVPIAIGALKAGKHVLVEKPMAMNEKELTTLLDVVTKSKTTFMIGFNRRFSPLSREAKRMLQGHNAPIVMNYRVANTFAPAASWIHDPVEGGGTIIGECCHFFDLLYWFIEKEPVRIFAEGGALSHPGKDIYDNTVISIKFSDGSIGNITFTDLGSEGFPKERIEIFSGNQTIVIDDFRKLNVYGPTHRETVLKTGDKGHYHEFLALAESIRHGKESPVSYIDGARAMLCCFKTLASIQNGAPQAVNLREFIP